MLINEFAAYMYRIFYIRLPHIRGEYFLYARQKYTMSPEEGGLTPYRYQ
jgi:hypothetical protein